jgi:hypothetical protein
MAAYLQCCLVGKLPGCCSSLISCCIVHVLTHTTCRLPSNSVWRLCSVLYFQIIKNRHIHPQHCLVCTTARCITDGDRLAAPSYHVNQPLHKLPYLISKPVLCSTPIIIQVIYQIVDLGVVVMETSPVSCPWLHLFTLLQCSVQQSAFNISSISGLWHADSGMTVYVWPSGNKSLTLTV